MATTQELTDIAVQWSLVIQQFMMTEHSIQLDTVPPKGEPTSVAALLANWGQAIPNTYAEPTEAQLLTALAVVLDNVTIQDNIIAVQESAHDDFANLPGWASWTQAELVSYLDTNIGDDAIDAITNLAEAKAMLKVMANIIEKEGQAIIYLRNHTLPDLQGSE